MKGMTEQDKAYLAGLIDGEGCITILKQKPRRERKSPAYRATLIISMTDYDIIEWCKSVTGVGFVTTSPPEKEHYKQQYRWVVNSGDGKMLLEELYDYLKVKKNEADVFIRFCGISYTIAGQGSRTPKRILDKKEKLFAALKGLKHNEPINTKELVVDINKNDLQPSLFV